ncbi:Unsaturated rhamnogalacturonyl hydrolase YteR [Pseudocercospora fuligena]|uniref:Unsaturated rhamnogalacturonyl hydrolase YteR n=1 Tax=Pseudocercospora fuligena TaxID=685502 RepID=A0A8H6VPA7_9PEZI|nr:Unsaturated rhamnogalacturonyl hydrolase YteR [Pseudocercospora fuligena]
MKLLILACAALVTTAHAKIDLPTGWQAIPPGQKITHETFHGGPRYLTWLADSQIKHGVEPTFAYTVSAYLSGVLLAYSRTSNPIYLDYVKRHADIVLYPAWNGEDILLHNNSNSIDDIRFGHTFLDIYNLTNGEEIYRQAASTLKKQIDRSYRTPAGGFYHRYPAYIDQMWLDGIYMLDVFYARYTATFEPDNTTAWDDIALQFDLIHSGTTILPNSNLPVHGFDVSKKSSWADPITGAAPHVWSRAVGWYIMALIDTLDFFPSTHPGHARLLSYYRIISTAVIEAQDPYSKGWHNILTPGYANASGNYIESSGTSMFVYALLKGIRLGHLERERFLKPALQGYEIMTSTFARERESDGALVYEWTVQTGSLSSNGTFEVSIMTLQELKKFYYASMPLFENDLKGVAPFLFSSYEYELFVEGKEGKKEK